MIRNDPFVLQFKGEVDKRNKAIKAYNYLDEFIEKPTMDKLEEIGKHVRILESSISEQSVKDSALEALRSLLASANSVSIQLQNRVKDEFSKVIQEEMGKANLKISGNYPLLKVSYYCLEVDFSRNQVTVWWGPQQERVTKCKCDGVEVTQRVLEHLQSMNKNPFDPKEHFAKLLQAYKAVVARSGKKEGDHVPIVPVHLELLIGLQGKSFVEDPIKEKLTEYSRCLFGFDLYRMVNSGIVRLGDYEIGITTSTFAKTNQRSDFIWIPTNDSGEGATRSEIYFQKVVT